MIILLRVYKIENYKFIEKYNKFMVELKIHRLGKKFFLLSEKQLKSLEKSFKKKPYPAKKNTVYIVVEKYQADKMRYIWNGINEDGRSYLVKKFGVDVDNSPF